MTTTEIIYLVLFVICLLLSAFFSGSETAFTALQRVRIEHMVNTKVPGAKRVAQMIQHPARLLSTILTGNNLVNTAAAALGTVLALSVWEEWGVLISTIGVSVILLIFLRVYPQDSGRPQRRENGHPGGAANPHCFHHIHPGGDHSEFNCH